MAIKKNTDIKIQVGLDENNIPQQMQWSAEDGGIKDQDTKAMLLSFWDSEQQEALKMDLWVKDMPVDQMQLFFYQTHSYHKNFPPNSYPLQGISLHSLGQI